MLMNKETPKKLLSYADLTERGHGSRTTIWRKSKDPDLNFPSPIDTGYGQKKWIEIEITAWESSRKVEQAQPSSTKKIKAKSHEHGFVIVKTGKNGRENTVCLTSVEAMEIADKLGQASQEWQW